MSAQPKIHSDQPAPTNGAVAWQIAELMATLLAIDPEGLMGITLRAQAGPVRDTWKKQFNALFPTGTPIVQAPFSADLQALSGGLDVAATLSSGKPSLQRGLLASANGGVLYVKMAERLSSGAAAAIAQAQDTGCVSIERDGFSERYPARSLVVLEDEGITEDEAPPDILLERLAFIIDLSPVSVRDAQAFSVDLSGVTAAQELLPRISVPPDVRSMLAQAGLELGAPSLRSFRFALNTARALAALAKVETVNQEIAQTAIALVYGPYESLPQEAESEERKTPPDPPASDQANEPSEMPNNNYQSDMSEPNDHTDHKHKDVSDETLADRIVQAVSTGAIDLQALRHVRIKRRRAKGSDGKAGATKLSDQTGRPRGSRSGDPRSGGRIDILATMRAAAPWRKLRAAPTAPMLLRIYPSDIRLKRFEQKTGTSVIFVVDASGSAAMHRLGEAKGAVERLLQECYTRRDMVSVIVFRGNAADVLLAPTRSLVRARRALASAPGGGGTPLASALKEAGRLAIDESAKGRDPLIVILSDGRGNIDLSGNPGRASAIDDEKKTAELLARQNINTIFFDIGRRPSATARELSEDLGARYMPLPFANSEQIADIVAAEANLEKSKK